MNRFNHCNCNTVRRYLNDTESTYLDQIEEMAETKAKILHGNAEKLLKI